MVLSHRGRAGAAPSGRTSAGPGTLVPPRAGVPPRGWSQQTHVRSERNRHVPTGAGMTRLDTGDPTGMSGTGGGGVQPPTQARTTPGQHSSVATAEGRRWLMLTLATVGFAVNFWAWALISPLGPLFRQQGTLGRLSESDVALMVAVPVVVGSLGRIVVGALTDRYGGRVMFPLISAVTIVPVLFIGVFGQTSYAALLLGGFFLGLGGGPFSVGAALVDGMVFPQGPGFWVGGLCGG